MTCVIDVDIDFILVTVKYSSYMSSFCPFWDSHISVQIFKLDGCGVSLGRIDIAKFSFM